MDLLSIIILFVAIAKIFKKNEPDKYEDVKKKAKELGSEVYGGLRGSVNNRRSDYEKKIKNFEQSARPTKIKEENDEARQQIYKSRMEAKNTTILQRAMANAQEDKEDVTLRSLEESHGHSAHVAPAVHHHPEDVIPEDSLKKIEDLMVKGYEAELCFERDFVGEAMDMVNRFSMGGSV